MNLVAEITALLQVVMVDLVLAGDNALVVGIVAAGLPRESRAKAIMIGIAAATLMRVAFAVVTSQLLQIIGLTLAGGLLLLWVSWKLWREIRQQQKIATGECEARPARSFGQAVRHIVLADISMSLDNVLAVAGVAREHTWVLVAGLVLSVAFMGLAASLIAGLLKRFHFLSYIGLAIVFYIALRMIYDGTMDVWGATAMAS
ncbi:MAG: YjbE family putative metal transport protein [Dongiaceae bacterium]